MESPVIIIPEDVECRQQLRNKLAEYHARTQPYGPPEMQMYTVCKITVLERLLRDGQVNTWELWREMAETYGSGLDGRAFESACGIIDAYCKASGQNVRGGMGVREPG